MKRRVRKPIEFTFKYTKQAAPGIKVYDYFTLDADKENLKAFKLFHKWLTKAIEYLEQGKK
jgi:hypothetical protein